ncbi:uncharacterized protein CTHT_0014560 [Thermochaetoides thermophila DSM 1495]|uniref:PARP-type domain-containing protein n=1 Tax=Chaetomium thermophilum (strain DSM 1495 / CBS 144.50 / IMI 039719) TaxID=759272 RepID=G0S1R7_CHATD|nr:hypothetical protein CTHT_0014560 [Thermochaetoides thermophila DSM 1495]EGS22977.1 hypothetical protein CTHT_0014560 [Thermochaetoides thermophila DSM 1495]
MSYRIEICPNNRALCRDKVCKEAGIKICKGELRLGTWVEVQDHGAWHWRHWGCVSGEQVVNMQKKYATDKPGEYNWEAIDGWEELENFPDVQEKVKRVIRQGHIDPEDFKGDPEMNKPGQKGIRKRKRKADDNEEEEQEEEHVERPTKKSKKGVKKAEVKEDPASASEEVAEKPKKAANGKRGSKVAVKEENVDDQNEGDAEPKKPKKAGRGKRGAKAIKEEEHDAEEEHNNIKTELGALVEEPKKKGSRSKKVKKEPTPESEPEAEHVSKEQEPEDTPSEEKVEEPAPKGKKARKPKVQANEKPASAPKKGRGKKA